MGCLQAELRASKQAVALARRNAAAPAAAAASGADAPVLEAATSSSNEPDLGGQTDAAEDKHQEDSGAVVYATDDMYIWEGTGCVRHLSVCGRGQPCFILSEQVPNISCIMHHSAKPSFEGCG